MIRPTMAPERTHILPAENPDLPGTHEAPQGSQWYPVCSVEAVDEEEPFFTAADGRDLMVIRQGARFTVFDDCCPHTHASMVGAVVEDGQVECPLHGACFDSSSGAVLDGPTTEDLVCHPVRIVADQVEAALPTSDSSF